MLILELQLELVVESAEERRRGRGRDFQLRRPEDEDEDEDGDERFERERVSWNSLSSQAGGAYRIERSKRRSPSQFSRIPPSFLASSSMQRERMWRGGRNKDDSH